MTRKIRWMITSKGVNRVLSTFLGVILQRRKMYLIIILLLVPALEFSLSTIPLSQTLKDPSRRDLATTF